MINTCCLRTQQDPDALYVHIMFVRLGLICGDDFRCVKCSQDMLVSSSSTLSYTSEWMLLYVCMLQPPRMMGAEGPG